MFEDPVSSTYPGAHIGALFGALMLCIFLGGHYTLQVIDLHKTDEVRVGDADFYLQTTGSNSDKLLDKWRVLSTRQMETSKSALSTVGYDLHRLRRAGLGLFDSTKTCPKASRRRRKPTA